MKLLSKYKKMRITFQTYVQWSKKSFECFYQRIVVSLLTMVELGYNSRKMVFFYKFLRKLKNKRLGC